MNIQNLNNKTIVNPKYIENIKHLDNIKNETVVLDFHELDDMESKLNYSSIKSMLIGWAMSKELHENKNIIIWDSFDITGGIINWISKGRK